MNLCSIISVNSFKHTHPPAHFALVAYPFSTNPAPTWRLWTTEPSAARPPDSGMLCMKSSGLLTAHDQAKASRLVAQEWHRRKIKTEVEKATTKKRSDKARGQTRVNFGMDFQHWREELKGWKMMLWVVTTAMLVVCVHYDNVRCFQTWTRHKVDMISDDNDALHSSIHCSFVDSSGCAGSCVLGGAALGVWGVLGPWGRLYTFKI